MDKHQKMFSLGQILSITDGHLMCEIGGVYEILNYLTGDELFTHQLPRAARTCKPYILQIYPQLNQFDGSTVTPHNYQEILETAEAKVGEFLPLSPLPAGLHLHIDPVAELGAMVGDGGAKASARMSAAERIERARRAGRASGLARKKKAAERKGGIRSDDK